jgi:hypothetical protein
MGGIYFRSHIREMLDTLHGYSDEDFPDDIDHLITNCRTYELKALAAQEENKAELVRLGKLKER